MLIFKTYELDGRLNNKDWSMKACQDVVRRFTANYPDFFGARVIFTVHRWEKHCTFLLWWIECRWMFSIITPVFSVTWSFRNHSNMLICCSIYISYNYQCWKQLCCFIFFVETVIHFLRVFWYIESSKEQHLFEILIWLKKIWIISCCS